MRIPLRLGLSCGFAVRAPRFALGRTTLVQALVWVYFVTLHADQLNAALGGFSLRLNNLIAFGIVGLLILLRFWCPIPLSRGMMAGVGLFMGSMFVSAMVGPEQGSTRALAFVGWGGMTLLCYFLLPMLLVVLLDELPLLKLYISSFLFVGAYALLQLLLSIVGFPDPFTGQRQGGWSRPNAFAYEPSYYALYMVPCAVILTVLFLLKSRQIAVSWRRLMAINVLLLVSTSSGAFAVYPLLWMLLLTFAWSRSMRMRFPPLWPAVRILGLGGGGCLLFLCAAFPSFAINYIFKVFTVGMAHHSIWMRVEGIFRAWVLFLDHPFLGVGIGGVASHFYGDYWETVLMTGEVGLAGESIKNFEPTNVLTELLASLGLVGLLACLVMGVSYCRTLFRSARDLLSDCCCCRSRCGYCGHGRGGWPG